MEINMNLINFDEYCDFGKFSDSYKMHSRILNGKLDYKQIYKDLFNRSNCYAVLNARLGQTYKDTLKDREENFLYDLDRAHRGASYFLTHAVVKGDINSLDVLLKSETEQEKRQSFAVLLFLLQQYSDLYRLINVYTNSDFWGVIGLADLSNPMFQCFHYVHFLANQKTKDGVKSFELSDITNLYTQGSIGTEAKILKTANKVVRPLVDKLISILKSDYYDEYFKEYFGTIEKRYNEVVSGDWHTNLNEEMMADIYNSTVSESDNLLYQKLKSLGFARK